MLRSHFNELKTPLISVIMPTYNNQQYMKETIEYILNQTLIDFEFIIVNDGSTDKTGDICQEFSKIDSRIKYYVRENGGISKAINQGLDLSTGKYILILDSDDIFAPNMFEIMYERAEETNSDITMCNWTMLELNGKESSPVLNQGEFPEANTFVVEDIIAATHRNVFTTTTTFYSNKLYLRSYIDNNDIRFVEDSPASPVSDGVFVPLTIVLASRISIIYDSLIKYRVINFHAKLQNQVLNILSMPIAIKSELERRGLYSKYKTEILDYLLNGNLIPRFGYYELSHIQETFEKLPLVFRELCVDSIDIGSVSLPEEFASAFATSDFLEYIRLQIEHRDREIEHRDREIEHRDREIEHRDREIEHRDDMIAELLNPKVRSLFKSLLRLIKHRFLTFPKGEVISNGKIRFVFTDSVLIHDRVSGIGHFAKELLLGIDRFLDHNDEFEVILATVSSRVSRLQKYNLRNIRISPLPLPLRIVLDIAKVDKVKYLDRFIGKAIYFSPVFVTWNVHKSSKTITCIPDISFMLPKIKEFAGGSARIMKRITDKTIRRADIITSISNNAAKEIEDHYKLKEDSVLITKCAADSERFYPRNCYEIRNVRDKYNISDNYFVIVSNIEPRKNHSNLIKAMLLLPDDVKKRYQLLIVGADGWKNDEVFELIKTARQNGVQILVLDNGIVSDDELPAIFSGAHMTIFPSFYEGFGMTPLESMLCGTPVVLSNISAMPEVAGRAGVYFDPYSPLEISESIQYILNLSKKEYDELVDKGYDQAKSFNWDDSVNVLMSAAKELAYK